MDKTSKISSGKKSLQVRHDKAIAELEMYKLLVESVEDYAIFLLDPEGYIMTWSKGAQKNKGYKASEIIGKHFSNFYLQHDIDAKKPQTELELATKFGRIEDEDWRVRKDGSQFWANVIITALFDENKNLVGFAKVTRDLTERKQQEDNLRKANSLLRKQQEELKRLNTSKDEFIALASHQLRTPSTAIKQLLGMLIEGLYGDLPEDLTPVIQKAYESNERQLAIVSSLLKVAEIDAGKVTLRKIPTDIGALLRDIIDEQADIIKRRKQVIVFEPAARPVIGEVDQKYIRMALENLIDNASKYTLERGKIFVAAALKDGYIMISIRDTGIGIATQNIATLFEKFNRIPNELSQKVSGTGLGLYWVREVINLHDGHIEVESRLHKGTTFNLRLPVENAHA